MALVRNLALVTHRYTLPIFNIIATIIVVNNNLIDSSSARAPSVIVISVESTVPDRVCRIIDKSRSVIYVSILNTYIHTT